MPWRTRDSQSKVTSLPPIFSDCRDYMRARLSSARPKKAAEALERHRLIAVHEKGSA